MSDNKEPDYGSIIFETADGDPVGVADTAEIYQAALGLAMTVFSKSDKFNDVSEALAIYQHVCGLSFPAVLTLAMQWGVTQIFEPVLQGRGKAFADHLRADLATQLHAHIERNTRAGDATNDEKPD